MSESVAHWGSSLIRFSDVVGRRDLCAIPVDRVKR